MAPTTSYHDRHSSNRYIFALFNHVVRQMILEVNSESEDIYRISAEYDKFDVLA